jgi:hypothetical protein
MLKSEMCLTIPYLIDSCDSIVKQAAQAAQQRAEREANGADIYIYIYIYIYVYIISYICGTTNGRHGASIARCKYTHLCTPQ